MACRSISWISLNGRIAWKRRRIEAGRMTAVPLALIAVLAVLLISQAAVSGIQHPRTSFGNEPGVTGRFTGYYTENGNVTLFNFALKPPDRPQGGVAFTIGFNGTMYNLTTNSSGYANLTLGHLPDNRNYPMYIGEDGRNVTLNATHRSALYYTSSFQGSGHGGSFSTGSGSSFNTSYILFDDGPVPTDHRYQALGILYYGGNSTGSPAITLSYSPDYSYGRGIEIASLVQPAQEENSATFFTGSGFNFTYASMEPPYSQATRAGGYYNVTMSQANGSVIMKQGAQQLVFIPYYGYIPEGATHLLYSSALKVIPLAGLLMGYVSFGRVKGTDSLDSIVSRPTTIRRFMTTRYLESAGYAAAISIFPALITYFYVAVSFPVAMDPEAIAQYSMISWTALLGFMGLAFLMSSFLSSGRSVITAIIALYLVFGLIWLHMPFGAGNSFYWASPAATFYLMDTTATGGSALIPLPSYILGHYVNFRIFGITVPLLAAECLWAVLPVALAVLIQRRLLGPHERKK